MVDASEESVLEALEAGQRYRATSIDVPDRQEVAHSRAVSAR